VYVCVSVCCRKYKYSDDFYHRVADNGNYTDRKHSEHGNTDDYRYYDQRFGAFLYLRA